MWFPDGFHGSGHQLKMLLHVNYTEVNIMSTTHVQGSDGGKLITTHNCPK